MTTLGKCLAEHKTSAAGFAKVVAIMVGSFAVAGTLCATSIAGGPGDTGGRVVLFVLGLFLSIPGFLCIYGLTRGRKNAVRIHENGIAIHKAGQDTAVLWDDVASYSVDAFLVIETKSDGAVDFGMSGLQGADEIVATLRREVVTLRTLPRWKSMLQDGESVALDGATIDAKGITLLDPERRLPWSAIAECSRVDVPAIGKAPIVMPRVAIRTADETHHLAVDGTSEREAVVALCNDMIAKPG